jgi:hypothetical protein
VVLAWRVFLLFVVLLPSSFHLVPSFHLLPFVLNFAF